MDPEITLAVSTVACFFACYALLRYEKRSKKWYSDRACLFSAGFFLALALVAGVALVVRLFQITA